MPAEDRARKPGALTPAREETRVSMRALLASCAAADAVSKPPSGNEDASKPEEVGVKHSKPVEECDSGALAPRGHPDQDAA
jgi:hypothetical protein